MHRFYLFNRFWFYLGYSTLLVTASALPGYPQTPEGSQLVPQPSVNQAPIQAAPVVAPASAAPDAAAAPNNYRLGPGDVIKINVFGAEEYSGEAMVLQDGAINLPQMGRVLVQGQTLQETSEAIAAAYRTYIRNPRITVTPIRLRPVRVAVAGEVSRPGSYTVQPTQNNQQQSFPTLTQIIAQAGGITATANLKAVEIRRPVGADQLQVTRINLWDLVRSGDLSQDVMLQGDDEVYIPTAANLSPQEMTELASANFAPASIQIYVTGEVAKPGLVEVPLNTPLNQAILAAGGFSQVANRGSVDLVRLNPNGTVTRRDVSINFSEGIDETDNPILMDQDVVVVGRSGLATFGQTAGMILEPFGRILSAILGIRGFIR